MVFIPFTSTGTILPYVQTGVLEFQKILFYLQNIGRMPPSLTVFAAYSIKKVAGRAGMLLGDGLHHFFRDLPAGQINGDPRESLTRGD